MLLLLVHDRLSRDLNCPSQVRMSAPDPDYIFAIHTIEVATNGNAAPAQPDCYLYKAMHFCKYRSGSGITLYILIILLEELVCDDFIAERV